MSHLINDHVTSKLGEDEFNESDLSSNYEIDEKFGKFNCDLCTEMFSSESNLVHKFVATVIAYGFSLSPPL